MAIDHWQRAGELTFGKSAYVEAANYFANAVELIALCNDRVDRRAQELRLQLQLGQAQGAAWTYRSAVTWRAFGRAYELLDADPEGDVRPAVLHGIWWCCVARGELRESLTWAQRALDELQDYPADSAHLVAHRILGSSYLYTGEFESARTHLTQALDLYDPRRHAGMAAQYGIDFGAAAACHLGFTLILLGYLEQGTTLVRKAREIASALPQISARVQMHWMSGLANIIARNREMIEADARALRDLERRYRFQIYKGGANCFAGWAALEHGRHADALEAFERGAKDLIPAVSTRYVLSGLALTLAACNRLEEARETIEQAILVSTNMGEAWCAPELRRIRGEIARLQANRAEAFDAFEQALNQAREQKSKLWELRAAVSLARLLAEQNERQKARNVLAPVYTWFAEGFATADLTQARALLEALS